MAKGYNWPQIETEYVSTKISMKQISEKYSIPVGTVQGYARKNKWSTKRKDFNQKVVEKAIENAEDSHIDRISTILRVSDKMLKTVEKAIDDPQLFYKIVTQDKKTGAIRTKTTKVFNTKKFRELSGALNDIMSLCTSKEDDGSGLVVEFDDRDDDMR